MPTAEPKSFRLQAMKQVYEQKNDSNDNTRITTNMLNQDLTPFCLNIFLKNLDLKIKHKKQELKDVGFVFEKEQRKQTRATL